MELNRSIFEPVVESIWNIINLYRFRSQIIIQWAIFDGVINTVYIVKQVLFSFSINQKLVMKSFTLFSNLQSKDKAKTNISSFYSSYFYGL